MGISWIIDYTVDKQINWRKKFNAYLNKQTVLTVIFI